MDSNGAYEPEMAEVNEVVRFIKRVRAEGSDAKSVKMEDKHAPILAFLLSYRGQQQGEEVQLFAADLLKNQVSGNLSLSPEQVVFVKNAALNGTCAPVTNIRERAAKVIYAYGSRNENAWPKLFVTLQQMLDSNSPAEVLGSFAIIKLFVNNPPKWLTYESNIDNTSPFGSLVNKLISLLSNIVQSTKEHSILSLLRLTSTCPNAVVPRFNGSLLPALLALQKDPSELVRKSAIEILLVVMDIEKVQLQDGIASIVTWMTNSVDDSNDKVACSACDFWVKFCTGTRSFDEALTPHLAVLLPQLVQSLVAKLMLPSLYAMHTQSELHDCAIPDENSNGGLIKDDEDETQFLRKSAAAALDALSSSNGSQNVLPVVLPLLQARLMHGDVWVRESGILALGTIAECQRDMNDHMLHIFPYLLKQLVDPTAQIRRITCWTLSRYTAWIFSSNQLSDTNIEELIQSLMMRVLDRHKLVQKAACSALTSMLGHAHQRLNPYLEYLLRNIMHAFTLYQSKNIPVLCDTIGTLADAVGMAVIPFTELIIPPLVMKWKQLCPSGTPPSSATMLQLCPLLECITSVVQALGNSVRPFAADLYRGAVEVMELQVSAEDHKLRDAGLICVLDLLAALARGLGSEFWIQFMTVKGSGGKSVYDMITICAKPELHSLEVRQSACSLIGEIIKGCGKQCTPIFDIIMPCLVVNLDLMHSPLFNNASWAIGELCVVVAPALIMPHTDKVMTSLYSLVKNDDAQIAKNAAITMGRIGSICPAQASLKLPLFFKAWCHQMLSLSNYVERENTSRALCLMILANQKSLSDNFSAFCEIANSWEVEGSEGGNDQLEMPKDVYQLFHDIFHSFLKEGNNKEKLSLYCSSVETGTASNLIKKFKLEPFSS